MHELLQRATVSDDHRNASRPDLTHLRYVYRPAGVLEWDGEQRRIPQRWQAIWRDSDDVARTWYPDRTTLSRPSTSDG
jgi:hypothetical protein